ncbi:MAG: transcriptional regulator, partial [Sciscionella sp.]|nr:transcriptional regulator [Sciscionella sp.]
MIARLPREVRGRHLPDDVRARLGRQLGARYIAGASIRDICAETGFTIGRVRRLLTDAGVRFRRRGGANKP